MGVVVPISMQRPFFMSDIKKRVSKRRLFLNNILMGLHKS